MGRHYRSAAAHNGLSSACARADAGGAHHGGPAAPQARRASLALADLDFQNSPKRPFNVGARWSAERRSVRAELLTPRLTKDGAQKLGRIVLYGPSTHERCRLISTPALGSGFCDCLRAAPRARVAPRRVPWSRRVRLTAAVGRRRLAAVVPSVKAIQRGASSTPNSGAHMHGTESRPVADHGLSSRRALHP